MSLYTKFKEWDWLRNQTADEKLTDALADSHRMFDHHVTMIARTKRDWCYWVYKFVYLVGFAPAVVSLLAKVFPSIDKLYFPVCGLMVMIMFGGAMTYLYREGVNFKHNLGHDNGLYELQRIRSWGWRWI